MILKSLIKRNTKLFFKDKGMFFTALITPLILLVLFFTFLGNVYRDTFVSAIPEGLSVPDGLLDGIVGGQLLSSLLSVSCVTVAFCSNLLMVTDKVTGARKDLTVSPVKASTLALSYYISTAVVTLIICLVAMIVGFGYLSATGWHLSLTDVVLTALDTFVLALFGTALSSLVCSFLSTQGQISAVGSIVSAGYGFISGAYMPISQFSDGIQKVITCLPGTYGTGLMRNHLMATPVAKLKDYGVPDEVCEIIKDLTDCNIYFFGTKVDESAMYVILGVTVVLLITALIFVTKRKTS